MASADSEQHAWGRGPDPKMCPHPGTPRYFGLREIPAGETLRDPGELGALKRPKVWFCLAEQGERTRNQGMSDPVGDGHLRAVSATTQARDVVRFLSYSSGFPIVHSLLLFAPAGWGTSKGPWNSFGDRSPTPVT